MAKTSEMKILERFVGTWDLESKTIVPETKAKEAPLKGVATVEWTLGDRFIQYRCHMNGWQDLQLNRGLIACPGGGRRGVCHTNGAGQRGSLQITSPERREEVQ